MNNPVVASLFSRANLCMALIWTCLSVPCRVDAQLVVDGTTNILDGVTTNYPGVTIGNFSSFTTMVLTNGAIVTNTDSVSLGGNSFSKSNSVIITAGSTWSSADRFTVGDVSPFNRLLVTAGGQLFCSRGNVGGAVSAASNNLALISDPGSLWMGGSNFNVGALSRETRLVVSNGGTLVSGLSYVGANNSASVGTLAVVTGTNSSWKTGNLNVGYTAGGSSHQIVVSNGARLDSSACIVGSASSHSNSVRVTGPGSIWTNSAYIQIGSGDNGCLLLVSNGAALVTGDLIVAFGGGNSHRVIFRGPGSIVRVRDYFSFGEEAYMNQLLITDGASVVANNSTIGSGTGNRSFATVSGVGTSWTNAGDLIIGWSSGIHGLTVTNGGRVSDNNAIVGYSIYGNNCSVLVRDPGSWWQHRSDLYIGYAGSSNGLTVTNSGLVTANNLYVGYLSQSTNNAVTVSGGQVFATNSPGSGTFDLRGGSLTLNSGLVRADRLFATNGSGSLILFNGGTLQVSNTVVTNDAAFVVGNGTNAAVFESLQAGSKHYFANNMVISSNGMLRGLGTILSDVYLENGATLSPGLVGGGLGTILINGNLHLNDGSTTFIRLMQTPTTNLADRVNCNQVMSFGGNLQLTNVSGVLGAGMSFKLFSANSFTGAFAQILPATPGPGLKWNTNQLTVDGTLRIAPGPPVIIDANLATNHLAITAAGIPFEPCVLTTSTNATLPLGSWQAIWTNQFDLDGRTTFTIPIENNEPSRFFRIRVNQ